MLFGFGVPFAPRQQEITMRQSGDALGSWMLRINGKIRGRLHGRLARIRIGKNKARELPSEAGFSNALTPTNDPGLGQTPSAISIKNLSLCAIMPEKL